MLKTLFVDKNSTENKNFYKTITAAINSIPAEDVDETVINIAPGRYYEQVVLERAHVTLRGMGDSPREVEIYHDLGANEILEDGVKRGTFRTYTFFAGADHITLENLTISNTSGEPKVVGQAIALYAEGDFITVKNCALKGRQDTLFTGPLPPKEIQPGGFIGPRQYAPRINGRQFYKNCYICGDVDFIFGSATAYFEDCTIESVTHDPANPASIQGYVTAGSTPEGQKYGYIFNNCDLIGPSLPDESVYLGRPWRDYARTVFLNCHFGGHIHSDGFHDWKKELARKNVHYYVYNCTREGMPFTPLAPFSKVIDDTLAAEFTYEKIFGGNNEV